MQKKKKNHINYETVMFTSHTQRYLPPPRCCLSSCGPGEPHCSGLVAQFDCCYPRLSSHPRSFFCSSLDFIFCYTFFSESDSEVSCEVDICVYIYRHRRLSVPLIFDYLFTLFFSALCVTILTIVQRMKGEEKIKVYRYESSATVRSSVVSVSRSV